MIEVVVLPPRRPRKPRLVRKVKNGLTKKKRSVVKRLKKKPTTTTKADTLFSKWIRARDAKCIRCGKTEYLQNSHFWPRAISSVRYDPENCDALCYGCHYGDRINGWEYAKQGAYRDFKLNQLGEEKYAALCERAKESVKRIDAINGVMQMMQNAVQLENEPAPSI